VRGLQILPAFVDRGIVRAINDELSKHDTSLVWKLTDTLEFHFALPKTIETASAIDLGA
jgi:hypothetical protein